MKPTKSTVCVLSQSPECGENLKLIVDSIGTYPCIVAASTGCLKRVSKDQRIKVVLLDRSMDVAEIEKMADLDNEVDLVTFGATNSSSDALSRIESMARYKLRHPATHKDLERLFGHLNSSADSETGRAPHRSSHLYRGLDGVSVAVRELRELIQKIAPSKSTVLITGETGTGKEIVARNIHYHSCQSEGPFVPVNCSAIPPDLLESELFGHRKGAFTGALSDREGRFAMAAGGTLFLDEIGDMTPVLQIKLLRVLEERFIYRVGCNKPIPMTGRLVAATHQNLQKCIENALFREDLFYRLNVVPIKVPPLRERKEDIPYLANELSCQLQRDQGITINFSSAAVACLKAYNWPGNVRELANLVERLAVTYPNDTADVADLPERYRKAPGSSDDKNFGESSVLSHSLTPQFLPEDGIDLKGFLKSTEATLIRQALDHSGGTVSHAAKILNIGRTTLTEKVKRLGLLDHVKAGS